MRATTTVTVVRVDEYNRPIFTDKYGDYTTPTPSSRTYALRLYARIRAKLRQVYGEQYDIERSLLQLAQHNANRVAKRFSHTGEIGDGRAMLPTATTRNKQITLHKRANELRRLERALVCEQCRVRLDFAAELGDLRTLHEKV